MNRSIASTARDQACRRFGTGAPAGWIALMVLALAPAAHAQNRVQNPNFNTTLAPWTRFASATPDPPGAGTAAWTGSEDANNNPASGAAAVTIAASPAQANAASGIDQCIVFPSTTVTQVNYGMSFKIPTADAADGAVNASVEIRLYSDAACSSFIPGAGGSQGRTIVAGVPDDVTWYTAGDPDFVLPAGTIAQSAEIRAYLRKAGSSSNGYNAYFDNLFLGLNGSVPVELQSFRVD